VRAFLVILALCSLPAPLFPLGKKEGPERAPPLSAEPPPKAPSAEPPPLVDSGLYDTVLPGQVVEITGRVHLVGSEPFPDLVLAEGDRFWYISRESRKVLAGYEQRIVTVRGKAELREMILADGRRLEDRRILSELSLIR
jgi:hypothetical protein